MIDMPNEHFDSETSKKLDNVAMRYQSQLDKFKEAARDLECDDDAKRFRERVGKLAVTKPKK
jgi:hypothetical protein